MQDEFFVGAAADGGRGAAAPATAAPPRQRKEADELDQLAKAFDRYCSYIVHPYELCRFCKRDMRCETDGFFVHQ